MQVAYFGNRYSPTIRLEGEFLQSSAVTCGVVSLHVPEEEATCEVKSEYAGIPLVFSTKGHLPPITRSASRNEIRKNYQNSYCCPTS